MTDQFKRELEAFIRAAVGWVEVERDEIGIEDGHDKSVAERIIADGNELLEKLSAQGS